MKVEQAQKQQREVQTTKAIGDKVACLQKQIMQDAQDCPADNQFEAILDAYARNPERWDGLE